jgi:hypothetical protein
VLSKIRARTDEVGMTVEIPSYSTEANLNYKSSKNSNQHPLSKSGVTIGGSSEMIIEEPELEDLTSRIFSLDQTNPTTPTRRTPRPKTQNSSSK